MTDYSRQHSIVGIGEDFQGSLVDVLGRMLHVSTEIRDELRGLREDGVLAQPAAPAGAFSRDEILALHAALNDQVRRTPIPIRRLAELMDKLQGMLSKGA